MTGEHSVPRKRIPWLLLIWLGAFLMLSALALPARAAGGFGGPVNPGALSPADSAGRVRAALTAQGYSITDVRLSSDGATAGVMMHPASRTSNAALQQQIRAGWQALAVSYPEASRLLSGYSTGDRYLVCCFASRTAQTTLAAGPVAVYDTLLGRWVQGKDFAGDFAHKAFGEAAWSDWLPPDMVSSPPGAAPPAALDGSHDAPGEPSASLRFMPVLDRAEDSVAMATGSRRRWLPDSDSVAVPLAQRSSGPAFANNDAPASSARQADPVGIQTVHQASGREAMTWTARSSLSCPDAEDSGEDPAGDPPPVNRPLLCPYPTTNTKPVPQASLLQLLPPAPTIHASATPNTISPAPSCLLAWPTLRVRPPPPCAPQRLD